MTRVALALLCAALSTSAAIAQSLSPECQNLYAQLQATSARMRAISDQTNQLAAEGRGYDPRGKCITLRLMDANSRMLELLLKRYVQACPARAPNFRTLDAGLRRIDDLAASRCHGVVGR